MSFEIEFQKRLKSAGRSFDLQISFTSQARRTVIYGPSGAGKSLCLQAIAGLLQPDSGRIKVLGKTLFDSTSGVNLPAQKRGLGFLFQDYALFPQLNVRQNIAFGLSTGLLNPAREVSSPAIERWLQAFELNELAQQLPHELSGGQRQRTALARALVNQPQALLLDEPFSSLDPALRERMRDELHILLDRIDIPMLMITHDPEDLRRFGDARLLLKQGRICHESPQDAQGHAE
jgi:molybdate transport system ATP-binding protein